MLFRSNSFRRQETELVIVVTPYLVKPVSDSQIVLPTDGYRNATDARRILLDKSSDSVSGETRPGPTLAPEDSARPSVGPAALTQPARATTKVAQRGEAPAPDAKSSAAPGFAF
jgi:pilus assembly protein CpaC